MERKEMEFGKKFRAGNFEYYKIVKTLSKREVNALRDAQGIPADVRKHLTRSGLPYMIVSAVSGGWSISYVCGTTMYNYIEHEHFQGEDGTKNLGSLFTMMYSDTAVFGDVQYWEDKANALRAYLARQKNEVSKEEDDKELERLKTEHDARESLKEMIKEGGTEDE